MRRGPAAARRSPSSRDVDWANTGFDARFLGTMLRINSMAFTVIGVAPKGFGGTMAVASPDLWLPLGVYEGIVQDRFTHGQATLMDRTNATLVLAARLRAGISREAADARLDTLSRQLEAAYPAENRDQLLSVQPLSRLSVSDEPVSDTPVAAGAVMLLTLSGCVLLLASLNLANVLLWRAVRRGARSWPSGWQSAAAAAGSSASCSPRAWFSR